MKKLFLLMLIGALAPQALFSAAAADDSDGWISDESYESADYPMDVFVSAAENNDIKTVKKFLSKKGFNPNKLDSQNRMAFRIATRKGHKEIVELLLPYIKDNIDIPNDDGKTALYYAVAYLHPEIVDLLLREGANPHKTFALAPSSSYPIPLFTLSVLSARRANQQEKSARILKLLLQREVDIYQQPQLPEISTAFKSVLLTCNTPALSVLLKHNVDLSKLTSIAELKDCGNLQKWNPNPSYKTMMDLLLTYIFNTNILGDFEDYSDDGGTIFHLAAACNSSEMIRKLIALHKKKQLKEQEAQHQKRIKFESEEL